MKLSEIILTETKFKIQVSDKNKNKWEDLAAELLSRKDVDDFFRQSSEDDADYRAISNNGKEIIKPMSAKMASALTGKNIPEPNGPLSRNASKDVHKRNEDFFKKHL